MPRTWETEQLWDDRRLAALKDFKDTSEEYKLGSRLTFLCEMACEFTKSPTSLITLVDGQDEYRLAGTGFKTPMTPVPINRSMCASVVDRGRALVIGDATEDPIFCDHVAVTEMGIKSYLGTPLRGIQKAILGSFCVFDFKPRDWTASEQEMMRNLSLQATAIVLGPHH